MRAHGRFGAIAVARPDRRYQFCMLGIGGVRHLGLRLQAEQMHMGMESPQRFA